MKNYKQWYLYILKCNDGSLYSGITVDIDKRMDVHKSGKGSKYVRSRLPVTLAAWWKFSISRSKITKLERFIKSLPAYQKRKLVRNPTLLKEYYKGWEENTILVINTKNNEVL